MGTWSTRRFAAVRIVFAAGVLCMLAGVIAPRMTEAAPAGSFSMSPSNIYLNIGDTVAITIIVDGGSDVHEVHFALSYDPSVVQVVDANAGQPGVQILQGPFPSGSIPGTMLQNSVAGGAITYQYQLPGAEEDGGTGTVATAQFVALANGSANFSWVTTQLVDGTGSPTNAGGSVATLLVGQASPTPGVTDTPTEAPTITETPTPGATQTPVRHGFGHDHRHGRPAHHDAYSGCHRDSGRGHTDRHLNGQSHHHLDSPDWKAATRRRRPVSDGPGRRPPQRR